MPAILREFSNFRARDRLRDVLIRAIRPDDEMALQAAMHRLSVESAYLRFFRPKHGLSPEELVYFTEVDFRDHVGLVAILREDDVEIISGVGWYIQLVGNTSR